MNKSGYEEKKWHACHPLSMAENSQGIQHDCIYRRDSLFVFGQALIIDNTNANHYHSHYYLLD